MKSYLDIKTIYKEIYYINNTIIYFLALNKD